MKGAFTMIKTIELTITEANNITVNKEGSVMWNRMTKKEQIAAQRMIDEVTSDRVEMFHDINGEAYLICHGGHIIVDGAEIGFLWYNKQVMISDLVYDDLVEKGFIKQGQQLNVICCYGRYQKSCRNINFINNTKKGVASRCAINKKGNAVLVVYTHDTLLEKLAAALKVESIIYNR